MQIKSLINTAKIFLKNNSSNILTVLSVLGVGVTVYTAHQDTLKADEALYRAGDPEDERGRFMATWKCYIPTAISATGTVACIFGSHYCDLKRAKALSSAYILSQTTLQEYQSKVIEKIGKNKARQLDEEVRQEVAHKQLTTCPQSVTDAIETGHGNTLFYDEVIPGGLYFKSDLNYLKAQVNEMNKAVFSEMEYDWNEIMYRWGLPYMKYGSDRVFTPEHLFDPKFVPDLMDNGQVRIIISYDLIPRGVN